MGNSNTSMSPVEIVTNKDKEHIHGQKLIRAIKANSRAQLEECMEIAKKETLTNNLKSAHDKDYETMIKKMTLYLTRGYNVGDGVLFTKTPLQIATELGCDQSIAFINEKLAELSKVDLATKVMEDKRATMPASHSAIGRVDRDRVNQAKERLKAFQNERKNASK